MKLRVLIHSNGSRAVTGFGKNAKNILLAFFNDPNIELIEAANGQRFGQDLKTPWESYGTFPADPAVLAKIKGDHFKERAASYGFYTIDEIIKKSKPDVYLGIEDIWAFTDFQKKEWWNKIPSVIWTTLDSLPILSMAEQMAPKTDKFFVWASFAEKELVKKGFDVKTIHGAVDYEHFYPLPDHERKAVKEKQGLSDNYVVGFVFKNQLRKSAPNLLEGFKLFQNKYPKSKSKLLLHTDWNDKCSGWDLPAYIKEKGLNPQDVLCVYICQKCKEYKIKPYEGEGKECPFCGHNDSFVTKSIGHGCSEKQLNELYNVMDVYCHPFTSGGQELPIQEAKAAGLITLVTNYSCGTDAVGEGTGGLPLDWTEYREPGTNFIKSTTIPDGISKQIEFVYNLPKDEKQKLSQEAIKYVQDNYSVQEVVKKLKKELLEFQKTEWDFDLTRKDYNIEYDPPEIESDADWLIDVYRGICYKTLKHNDTEIKVGQRLIANDGRQSVLNYIKNEAAKKNIEAQPQKTFEDFLGDEGEENRIAVVIPESAGDVLMVNGLIENLHNLYPNKNIYVITKEMYFDMINDNPLVHCLIPYHDGLDNLLYLEGRGDHKGFFQMAFLPFVGSQRCLNYLHNGKDISSLCT